MIIVDANVAGEFTARTQEAVEITQWLRRDGKISTGGKNLSELSKTKFAAVLIELIRAGRGVKVSSELIDNAQSTLDVAVLTSDDAHVLALAIAGGARLLYSKDRALMTDFKNAAVINRPRGSCYSHAVDHTHLLIKGHRSRRRRGGSI